MAADHQPALQPVTDPKRINAIVEAVSTFDLEDTETWAKVAELSTHTSFLELDAVPDGLFSRPDGKVEVLGTAYVKLVYGDRNDSLAMTESYSAKLVGTFDDHDKFIIEDASVDTSAF